MDLVTGLSSSGLEVSATSPQYWNHFEILFQRPKLRNFYVLVFFSFKKNVILGSEFESSTKEPTS